MKTIAWTMTADTAMEFFKRCEERKAETEQERINILLELANEGRMTNITATNKTKDEYVDERAKHSDVLYIRRKHETN